MSIIGVFLYIYSTKKTLGIDEKKTVNNSWAVKYAIAALLAYSANREVKKIKIPSYSIFEEK
jgi:DNA-binding XRE family transcriptional regulator